MLNGLIAKKLGMQSVYSLTGEYIPITIIQIGPCVVTQIKTKETDGYSVLQLGFGTVRDSLVNKPLKGHFNKSGKGCFGILKEFSFDDVDEYKLGQVVSANIFKIGELVDVTGVTKGRGFSGVIRRHGFHGGRKTHGSHSHRIPGSIGCSAWPAKVIKGKKMPGQYGNNRKTVQNLKVIDVRSDENIMLLKGAVPGYKSGYIIVKKQKGNIL